MGTSPLAVFLDVGMLFGIRTMLFNQVINHSIDLSLWNKQGANAQLIYFPRKDWSNKRDEECCDGVVGDKFENCIHMTIGDEVMGICIPPQIRIFLSYFTK